MIDGSSLFNALSLIPVFVVTSVRLVLVEPIIDSMKTQHGR